MLESAGAVSRGVFAMALNAVLFHELLTRVPTAVAYVADRRRQGERIIFDHGALRTIRFAARDTGALRRRGVVQRAFCSRSGMTWRAPIARPVAYDRIRVAHREFPETLPQFLRERVACRTVFQEFQAAAERVFGNTRDPLTRLRKRRSRLRRDWSLRNEACGTFLREKLPLLSAVGTRSRAWSIPDLARGIAECAWIARRLGVQPPTDRVQDVAMDGLRARSLGRR